MNACEILCNPVAIRSSGSSGGGKAARFQFSRRLPRAEEHSDQILAGEKARGVRRAADAALGGESEQSQTIPEPSPKYVSTRSDIGAEHAETVIGRLSRSVENGTTRVFRPPRNAKVQITDPKARDTRQFGGGTKGSTTD